MADKNTNESLYEELKGFFPEEYDLTPDELDSAVSEDDELIEAEEPEDEITSDECEAEAAEIIEDSSEEPTEDHSDYEEKAESKPELKQTKQTKKKLTLADVYDILEMFAVCTACIIFFFSFFARLTIVDGDSMNNTLRDGEYLVISDFMYDPTQGDIVVLQNSSLDHPELKKPLIKRIIATEGQTVDISAAGIVTVTDMDGKATTLTETYAYFENGYYQYPSGHYEVPEGCVFVMGDNRNGSTDSRDSRVGYVDERCIIGKALVRILPLNTFGTITNPNEKE